MLLGTVSPRGRIPTRPVEDPYLEPRPLGWRTSVAQLAEVTFVGTYVSVLWLGEPTLLLIALICILSAFPLLCAALLAAPYRIVWRLPRFQAMVTVVACPTTLIVAILAWEPLEDPRVRGMLLRYVLGALTQLVVLAMAHLDLGASTPILHAVGPATSRPLPPFAT